MNIDEKTPPDLQQYIDDCENSLLNGEPTIFEFPKELIGGEITDPAWKEKIGEIKNLNKKLLSSLRNNANLYAIFTKEEGKNWSVKYVGERKSVDMRQRISNHLISKNENTGAKLDDVRRAVSKGEIIGLRFIHVTRESLRTCVEEEIISRNKERLSWNKHG